ncbi:PPOX class F420-dependent oxidoreductase [Allokutzneria oryzae]|uniref:PPOX class F420-dependent oxidoreductase n=1 Tax=Allokutzneria oryzae TaxID=1378989 RepID=A0ABV5ZQS2_9PSEU
MPHDVDRLSSGKYVLLTTFRRDGTPVPTPVWVMRDGDELVVWTPVDSGKVKRIRNNDTVELAPCDVRGNPTGAPVLGRARLLDAAGTERARRLVARKFPFSGRVVLWGSLLRRGRAGTVGIALRPGEA